MDDEPPAEQHDFSPEICWFRNSYSPFNVHAVPAVSSHSSVCPTLTGAAGDSFPLSSHSSAGKSVRQYCLTWLPLRGIFATIFLRYESVVIAFCPAGWPWMLNQVQKWQLALLAYSSHCGCKNRGGGGQTLSRHAWNKTFVPLYLRLNHYKLIWKRCKKQ